MTQTLSRRGAMALLAEEGIVLRAYKCSAGVWTIGAGHTSQAGPPKVVPGMIISLERALQIFRDDIRPFEAAVRRAIRMPLTQHQFDALVSFHFNTGAISSGSVDEKLNRGDIEAALATLRQYNKAAGQVNDGLVKRRNREAAMFRHGEYFERAILLENAAGVRSSLWPTALPWPAGAEPAPAPEPAPQPAPEPAVKEFLTPAAPPGADPTGKERLHVPPAVGRNIAAWLIGLAGVLIAALAAWIVKGH